MTLDDEIRIYLPKYLSAENYETLIKELEGFPDNIDQRMYTSITDDELLCQGDVIKDMPYVEIDHMEMGVKNEDCIVLSNTCDIDPNNKRFFNSRIMYAPLIGLAKYKKVLLDHGVSEQQVNGHISSIKNQRVSQVLFLPQSQFFDESIVFLDRIINIDHRYIDRVTLKDRRLVSLSDYGFYLLLFKISVHFCRLQENVVRGEKYGV